MIVRKLKGNGSDITFSLEVTGLTAEEIEKM